MAAPAPIAAQMGMIQPPFGPGRWCPPAQLANWVVLSPVDQATYITNYNSKSSLSLSRGVLIPFRGDRS